MLFFISVVVGWCWPGRAAAADLTLFARQECVHCQDEKAFLETIKPEFPDLRVLEYDVATSDGLAKFKEYQQTHDIKALVTPVTVIGDQVIVGFNRPEDSGAQIKAALRGERVTGQAGATCTTDASQDCAVPSSRVVSLPLFGELDLSKLSLPVLTTVVGLADGYNPCAMWSFVALLSFLLALNSRRKIALVGGVFLLTSFLASWIYLLGWYGLFQWAFAWQAVVQVPGLMNVTKGMLGVLSLILAWRFFRDWRTNPQECEVTSPATRSRILRQLQAVAARESLMLACLGAAVLAVVVNVVEFLCSLGLPVVYSSVLVERGVSQSTAVGYITLYNVFYMADDLVVFAFVLLTSRMILSNWRGARWLKLAAALLLAWAAWSFISPLLS